MKYDFDTVINRRGTDSVKWNVTAGSVYGEAGKNFLRMNIACPKATLEEGLNRLKKGMTRGDRD